MSFSHVVTYSLICLALCCCKYEIDKLDERIEQLEGKYEVID